jgi:hypothetical protein
MGIDIYARWKGQTAKEKKAQITGWSVLHGHVGYLREAYHGEPYATHYLVSEAFKGGEVKIPAAVLRERLPHTLEIARERQRTLYKETDERDTQAILQSFIDFVELCERKETETGGPVTITASF